MSPMSSTVPPLSSHTSIELALPSRTPRGCVDWNSCVLRILWHLLHVVVRIWYIAEGIVGAIESYLISIGVLKRYKDIEIGKVKYLAVVIDSEEACRIPKVIQLLHWLASLGVKRLCLYDSHGILKKNKERILDKLGNATVIEEAVGKDSPTEHLTLEFASISDGKEAVARAASSLLSKHLNSSRNIAGKEEQFVSEAQLTEALQAIGYRGQEPDLMLVYGPARCHLGFPPWRIRYTEIIHMGSLKFLRRGSLMKAIYRFTMVRQNYGK